MDEPTSPDPPPSSPLASLRRIYGHFWSVFLRGVAIIVPVIVTIYLVTIALDFIRSALVPVVEILQYFGLIATVREIDAVRTLIELDVSTYVVDFLTELIALAILLAIVLIVGSVGHNRYGEQAIQMVDLTIAAIPGVGTVYKSFRRMSDVMLTDDGDNFQDIKLVQCLDEDMYVIGFQTSAAPSAVEEATDNDDMMTLFVPMAPNPVTGGFLTYVPTDRVYDVDMTIEDGVKSILTSGVATGRGAENAEQLSFDDVRNVAQVDRIQDAIAGKRVEPPEEEEEEEEEESAVESGEDDGVDEMQ